MNIIKFKSDNIFLSDHFQQIYNQKIKSETLENSKSIILSIKIKNQKIEIRNHEINLNYNCPIFFNQIFIDIQSYLFQFKFVLGDALFFPFSNLIKKNKQVIKLNFIHNTILTLILFNEDGFNKEELYKIIWPNDYHISANKLDTHFTNLKDIVKLKFDIDLVLKSYQGSVSLIIN